MAREVITTALLAIASIIAVAALIKAAIPSIHSMAGTFNSLAENMEERIETNVDIIFISVNSGKDTVYIWVKNIGNNKIPVGYVNKSDLFIYSSSNYWHVLFNSASHPTWDYEFENGDGDNYWETGETIKITVQFGSALSSDEYTADFILYNGISTSDIFSVG
ncbi:hypothetical protein DRP05_02400 [Archaeoglobales archaeon]|nr:MAG: hypothetical protein DRP05_02400 [Archaeoglobales archaeon]